MTEFSVSDVFYTGGTKKSRSFFEAYFKNINLWDLEDKFFREYYRSGNVFVYRFDSKIKSSEVNKLVRSFGGTSKASATIPARYMILNPADIQVGGNISFSRGTYYKLLTDYELQRLKSPRTPEDEQVLKGLSPELREKIKSSGSTSVSIPLDPDKISAVFYKKQDYEPFSVPMAFPVLADLNWKAEMKKMDMAITRTTQQAILLVTMGTEPDKGGINQKNLGAMQTLFQNESVGRVLISDYTTKAEFVVPKIADLLDPKKYEVVDRDIALGLNNVLMGTNERFANANIKIEVFIGRLRQARKAFLNNFLLPEIKRISKQLGFRASPIPEFDKISLRDDGLISRVYSRLVEIGVLTAEEGITAIETGRLPKSGESVESQEQYLKYKKKGLYEPIIGAGGHPDNPNATAPVQQQNNKPKPNLPKQAGRPAGIKTPQMTKNVKPIGESQRGLRPQSISTNYSLSKVSENMVLAQKLNRQVEVNLRKKHKIKRLNKAQKSVAEEITNIIVANEEPKNWTKKINSYIDKPVDQNPDRVKEIREVAFEHQLDDYLASILYISGV